MPTSLQWQANRANAHRSTGPRSRAGKARSAHNARRHGLSIAVWADPALAAEAQALALELAGPAASLELQQWARIAAVAHIDVDRVRRARHSLLMRGLDDPVPLPTTPRAAIKQTKTSSVSMSFHRKSSTFPGISERRPGFRKGRTKLCS
jgi:hypothetical protein